MTSNHRGSIFSSGLNSSPSSASLAVSSSSASLSSGFSSVASWAKNKIQRQPATGVYTVHNNNLPVHSNQFSLNLAPANLSSTPNTNSPTVTSPAESSSVVRDYIGPLDEFIESNQGSVSFPVQLTAKNDELVYHMFTVDLRNNFLYIDATSSAMFHSGSKATEVHTMNFNTAVQNSSVVQTPAVKFTYRISQLKSIERLDRESNRVRCILSFEESDVYRLNSYNCNYCFEQLMVGFPDYPSRDKFCQLMHLLNRHTVFLPLTNNTLPVDKQLIGWLADSDSDHCMRCNTAFSFSTRRHHCRFCGKLFCGPCSSRQATLPEKGYNKPVRICIDDFELISNRRIQALITNPTTKEPDSPLITNSIQPNITLEPITNNSNSINNNTTNTIAKKQHVRSNSSVPGLISPTNTSVASTYNSTIRTAIDSPPHTDSPSSHSQPSSTLVSERVTVKQIKSTFMNAPVASKPDSDSQTAAIETITDFLSSFEPVSSSTLPPLLTQTTTNTARDRFGFRLEQDESNQPNNSVKTPQLSLAAQLTKQRERWNEYLALNPVVERCTTLKRLIRKGIPTELRGQIWCLLSGAREHQSTFLPNYYTELVNQVCSEPSISATEIEKDLHRTFPDNALYESAAGLAMLRRVLLAFSKHNPIIGYCQSMNFLCALSLLFMDEEEAFWLLVVTCEQFCVVPHSQSSTNEYGLNSRQTDEFGRSLPVLYYHQSDLAGAHVDQAVFMDLLLEKLPKIAQHLERLKFPLPPILMNWFLCLFVNSLPLDTVLHVWDCMFCEGPKMYFRAGLALMKINEKAILKCVDFEELMQVIKTMHSHPTVQDPLLFTSACFDQMWIGSFSYNTIQRMRENHKARVLNELSERKLKTQQRAEAARLAKEQRDKDNSANTNDKNNGESAKITGNSNNIAASENSPASSTSTSAALTPITSNNQLTTGTRGETSILSRGISGSSIVPSELARRFSPPNLPTLHSQLSQPPQNSSSPPTISSVSLRAALNVPQSPSHAQTSIETFDSPRLAASNSFVLDPKYSTRFGMLNLLGNLPATNTSTLTGRINLPTAVASIGSSSSSAPVQPSTHLSAMTKTEENEDGFIHVLRRVQGAKSSAVNLNSTSSRSFNGLSSGDQLRLPVDVNILAHHKLRPVNSNNSLAGGKLVTESSSPSPANPYTAARFVTNSTIKSPAAANNISKH